MSTPPPSDQEIEQRRAEIGEQEQIPIVCFSGFEPEELDALAKVCQFVRHTYS